MFMALRVPDSRATEDGDEARGGATYCRRKGDTDCTRHRWADGGARTRRSALVLRRNELLDSGHRSATERKIRPATSTAGASSWCHHGGVDFLCLVDDAIEDGKSFVDQAGVRACIENADVSDVADKVGWHAMEKLERLDTSSVQAIGVD